MFILFVPWLFLFALMFTIVTLLKRRWVISAILILLILWGNWYYHLFPVSLSLQKDGPSLKVLTFNINGGQQDSISLKGISQIILKEDADVIFIAEDFLHKLVNTQEGLTKRYPYNSTSFFQVGHYLLSKMPIETAEQIGEKKKSLLYKFTVVFEGDSLHLYGCHMASNNYTASDNYMLPDSLKEIRDIFMYLNNVTLASVKREHEAELLLNRIKSSEKNIILGDFNDISGSYPLSMIERAGFTDAWWKGGNGYGATIFHLIPYRIDHIFYNDELELKSIRKIDSHGLSDHDALVADFCLKYK